jgi:hypothetical protein
MAAYRGCGLGPLVPWRGILGNEMGLHEGDWVVLVWQQTCPSWPNANVEWCSQEFNKFWPEAIRNHWNYAALLGLVPIPLGWLTAYGIIALVRWIRAGFKVPTSPI